MSKKLKDIEMQDWIILRLIVHSVGLRVGIADRLNAMTYLSRKYGYKTMCKAIAALHKENNDE